MKRPACFLGTHSMSHVQELSRTAENGSSFLSCCLQNLPKRLKRPLLPRQGEGWVFASGHHIQRRPEFNRESVSCGQHSAAVQLTASISYYRGCCTQGRTCLGPRPLYLLLLCPQAERAGDHRIPIREASAKQAAGRGMGKCWFGSAPSYSLNPLLTPSPPIFGCFPWSRHCFPTAPFQKQLKETSSVAFSLVCAKTASYTKAS